MAKSSIEWTEMTWNPLTGCTKISAGCKNCYAEVMSRRLQAMGSEKYKNAFQLTLHEDTLQIPYTWKKQKIVFVNSMSDLFHEEVPLDFIQKFFRVMNENLQNTIQVLTKRAVRLLRFNKNLNWTHNGDILVFYRTGGLYKSVVTTIAIVDNVYKTFKDEADFIGKCRKRSVFTDEKLKEHWNTKSKPFLVNFLSVYSFPNRINLKRLIELAVNADIESAPRGFGKITREQFLTILKDIKTDESIIVN